MRPEDAEEYTQALGQVVAGGWRQIALGKRLGVPEALGVSVQAWVEQRLGGYVKLSVEERKQAAKELVDEQKYSQREAAAILGVEPMTVSRDLRPVTNVTPELLSQAQPEVLPVTNVTSDSSPLNIMAGLAASEDVRGQAAKIEQRERREEERQKLHVMPAVVPVGKFSTIVIDPPWPIEKIERDVRPNQHVMDYPTMSLDEIAALPIAERANPEGCHIYLWVTHKYLPDGLRLLERWGFRYQCMMTWVKNVGFTPFSWMYSTEHVLFGRVGSLDLLKLGMRLDFQGKVREHSRKPDEFYDIVRQASPGPRLEMFARERRDGFEVWGNESERFTNMAARQELVG